MNQDIVPTLYKNSIKCFLSIKLVVALSRQPALNYKCSYSIVEYK